MVVDCLSPEPETQLYFAHKLGLICIFRTEAGDGDPIPLNEGEVIIWKTKDFDEIRIEWVDRCAQNFQLQICRQPQNVDCRSFDVSAPGDATEAYPSQGSML